MLKIGRQKIVCFITMGFLLEIGLQFYSDGMKQLVSTTNSSPNERYQLLEGYTHDSLSEIDPPFKRILFWNEVYTKKMFIKIESLSLM
jgi:hypothetical protein